MALLQLSPELISRSFPGHLYTKTVQPHARAGQIYTPTLVRPGTGVVRNGLGLFLGVGPPPLVSDWGFLVQIGFGGRAMPPKSKLNQFRAKDKN